MEGKQKKEKEKSRVLTLAILGIFIVATSTASWYAYQTYFKETSSRLTVTSWPTVRWTSCTPEAVGLDSVKLAGGLETTKKNLISIHSLMLVRKGSVFLDAYFYPYNGSTYHDMASVTKSVMTTLIGMAADEGKLDLDKPLLSFFPDRTIANRDSRKERITVRHLLSMSSGLSCTAVPSEYTLANMRQSDDWIQYTLDLPMAYEPGTSFTYNSPGMHLLSAILKKATGVSALEYAEEKLFKPLGITDVYWPSDSQGNSHGWGDLCLHPEDAAKLGLLFLHDGQWDGKQVVSAEWVKDATKKQTATGSAKAEDYGYGWYISREDLFFFRADGANGQRILVIPSMDFVLVTTGGGFELDEVTPFIEASIVDLEKALPENPAGAAQLMNAVEKCKESPLAQQLPPLPDTVTSVSTKTFTFSSNLIQLRSLRLDFNASAVALFQLDFANEPIPRLVVVGLDGIFRASIGGRPSVARGSWSDPKTFTIDYNEGPGINFYKFVLRFNDAGVIFEISGLGKIEGRIIA